MIGGALLAPVPGAGSQLVRDFAANSPEYRAFRPSRDFSWSFDRTTSRPETPYPRRLVSKVETWVAPVRMGSVDESRPASIRSEPAVSGALIGEGAAPSQSGLPIRAMKIATPEEGQILVRHREGDADAFRELVSRYRAPVYAYLVRCGVDPSQRDDLFQDIFLKVHGAAHAYDPAHPLHPWMFTIVANTVRSHFRRARVRKLVQFERAPEPTTPADYGQQQLEAEEMAGWLSEAIAQLPLPQREVVLLSCLENWVQKDVAEALAIPVNTVKTHLRRARLELAKALVRRQGAFKREVLS